MEKRKVWKEEKTLSLPTLKPQPTWILYVTAVVLACLFIMGFLWFCLYAVFTQIQTAVASTMSQYDIANTTYTSYELADTFITNIWVYFLAIFLLGISYWVYIYSSRKGVSVYG